ncbi:AsmA family protein [Photobacterium sanctipauli]|uniref:AsmA family protein n=1 Tax=Photobacterium sanctipauli TaxID=1342794 RepID=A0A2T3NF20_9GAMM|nr:AsmA family protein [Photobacterium sanctipauli]PSW13111.1 AsmA family protein [Photobacterium sanctipauli]
MRLLGKLLATMLVLALLATTIFATMMHTRYATRLALATANLASPHPISAEAVHYHISSPWQLVIDKPEIQLNDEIEAGGNPPSWAANKISLWLSPAALLEQRWQFESLLIEAPSSLPSAFSPLGAEVSSQRLALTDVDLQYGGLAITGGEFQLDNWHYDPHSGLPPWQQFNGGFQLSADQVEWQSQAAKQVLLDGHHSQGRWTLNGFSLDWQQADISGQLAYHQQQSLLDVQQLTLSGLQLQEPELAKQLSAMVQNMAQAGTQVFLERLDILDSSIELPDITVNHANLSLQNWHWPQPHWQQQAATLSFNAEDGIWLDTPFTAALAELHFAPQQITVSGLSVSLLEGYLRTAGTLLPDAILLDSLTANGIKWLAPQGWQQSLQGPLANIKDISVGSLDTGYLQLTAADDDKPWQLSGLHLNGHDLIVMRDKQWGLWQGALSSNASFASFNRINMVEPLIEMTANQGNWQLTQAIIPFEHGIAEASGQWQRNIDGQPWSLSLTGDSLPVAIIDRWLGIELPLKGKWDLDTQLSGLGQSQAALAYSLDGKLSSQFRDLELTTPATALWQSWQKTVPEGQEEGSAQTVSTPKAQPVAITPFSITSNRGRVVIAPAELKSRELRATIAGNWDLASPPEQQLTLEAWLGCQALTKVWQHDQQITSHSLCDGNNI